MHKKLFHRGDEEICILKGEGAAETRMFHSDGHDKKPTKLRPTSGPKFCPEARKNEITETTYQLQKKYI